jgi:hypothetical protein
LRIPKHRVIHGKRLSSNMQSLMYSKYIKGYAKYRTRLEEKPLMGEILEEILDLSNYYLAFAEKACQLVQDAKSKKSATYLRKQIIKLLG